MSVGEMAHTAHVEIIGKIGFFPFCVGEYVGETWRKGSKSCVPYWNYE